MRILIGCEVWDEVRSRFEEKGFDAWSCDVKQSKNLNNKKHIQSDLLSILNQGWDALIAFPPCTFLTTTGARWLYHPDDKNLHITKRRPHPLYPNRKDDQKKAIAFFKTLYNCSIRYVALENPAINVINTTFKKPSQVIHPYYFGDNAQKATGLWLKNLPPLVWTPTNTIFDDVVTVVEKGNIKEYGAKKRKMATWYNNKSIRDKTFPGIAQAMVDQWSKYLTNASKNKRSI